MEYDLDPQKNEVQKIANGQREVVTLEQFNHWFGDDNLNVDQLSELLLDIANGMYSINDLIKDLKDHE